MNIHKKISKFNYKKGTIDRIKYIVIHYCGSLGDAEKQVNFFYDTKRNASAHYFVGYNGDIWQSVEDADIAWHCGSTKYRHRVCRNTNSLGIEMCCKTTGSPKVADGNWYFEDATVKAAIELTKYLMDKYHVNPDNVLRHFDVTGKMCPAPYVFNYGKHTWTDFKKAIRGNDMEPVKESKSNQTDSLMSELTESGRAQVIWDFLSKECGLNDYATAGVMGNLYAESGLNPRNLQNGFEKKFGMNDDQYTEAVDDGTYLKETFFKDKAGYGLAQWTFWSRKNGLYEYIKSKGKSIGDLRSQLEYFWKEISSNGPLLAKLKGSKSVTDASNAILHLYERPADQSAAVENRRAEYGERFLKSNSQNSPGEKIEKTIQNSMSTIEYKVKVDHEFLNIRTGPGVEFETTGSYTGVGIFTIVETKGGWGKLKSGQGWISLRYAKKI